KQLQHACRQTPAPEVNYLLETIRVCAAGKAAISAVLLQRSVHRDDEYNGLCRGRCRHNSHDLGLPRHRPKTPPTVYKERRDTHRRGHIFARVRLPFPNQSYALRWADMT